MKFSFINIIRNTNRNISVCILNIILLSIVNTSCEKEKITSKLDCVLIPPYQEVGFGYNMLGTIKNKLINWT